MYGNGVVDVVARLATAEPFCCDRDGLADLVAMTQRVRSWLDALDARIALRSRVLADQGACEAPASLLTGDGRRSARDAEAAAARAGTCEQMPSFHDALSAGDVSAGHLDAVARLSAGLDEAGRSELKTLEPNLVESARTKPVEEFARECRELDRVLSRDEGVSRLAQLKRQRRLKRWIDRQSGMCKTLLELDPETDAKVSSALSAALAAEQARPQAADTTWDQLQADAFVGLITGARSLDQRVPEVSVLIDLQTLTDSVHDHSLCETADGNPLPPQTVRRLCCDAEILPIVLGGNGEVLDVGREQRLATQAQRRALRAMYRTCAYPGCQVGFDACRIHHVTWWDDLGPTALENLLPLCSVHHHLVHEGGWSLSLQPDRTIILHRSDGTLFFEGSTTNRSAPPTTTVTPTPPLLADGVNTNADAASFEIRHDVEKTQAAVAEALALIASRHAEPGFTTDAPELHLSRPPPCATAV
jgi:hypothetical protein